MMTQKEISAGVSIWDSKAWLNRREVRTGISGGRNRPLPAHIRRLIRTMEVPKQGHKPESFIKRARNFFGGKRAMPQKVV